MFGLDLPEHFYKRIDAMVDQIELPIPLFHTVRATGAAQEKKKKKKKLEKARNWKKRALFIVHCSLCIVRCSLFFGHCSLFIAHCSLLITHWRAHGTALEQGGLGCSGCTAARARAGPAALLRVRIAA